MQVQQGKGLNLCKVRVTPCDGLSLRFLRSAASQVVERFGIHNSASAETHSPAPGFDSGSMATDDLAEAARILSMQAAHYARKYGEMPIPDLAHLLTSTTVDDDSVGLLRDGTEALVGVLAMVTGAGGVDMDDPVQ
jgi:hypothetical protein